MLKGLVFATLASVTALTATPALADAHTDTSNEAIERELSAMGDLFGDMFGTAEPLTPEQEARVPMAQSVVIKLFPEGTYVKMMDEAMGPMMDSMLGNIAGSPAILLMEMTGLSPSELSDIDNARLEAAVELLDPGAKARNAEIADMSMSLMSDIVVQIEPSYRAGLARAYAVRFTEAELTELDAYFATPVGSKYAAESFLIFADPQVMSAMNQMMPAVMEAMPAMMGDIGDIGARYPKGRTFSDLSSAEQDKLASLLGVTLEELAASEPEAEADAQPKAK